MRKILLLSLGLTLGSLTSSSVVFADSFSFTSVNYSILAGNAQGDALITCPTDSPAAGVYSPDICMRYADGEVLKLSDHGFANSAKNTLVTGKGGLVQYSWAFNEETYGHDLTMHFKLRGQAADDWSLELNGKPYAFKAVGNSDSFRVYNANRLGYRDYSAQSITTFFLDRKFAGEASALLQDLQSTQSAKVAYPEWFFNSEGVDVLRQKVKGTRFKAYSRELGAVGFSVPSTLASHRFVGLNANREMLFFNPDTLNVQLYQANEGYTKVTLLWSKTAPKTFNGRSFVQTFVSSSDTEDKEYLKEAKGITAALAETGEAAINYFPTFYYSEGHLAYINAKSVESFSCAFPPAIDSDFTFMGRITSVHKVGGQLAIKRHSGGEAFDTVLIGRTGLPYKNYCATVTTTIGGSGCSTYAKKSTSVVDVGPTNSDPKKDLQCYLDVKLTKPDAKGVLKPMVGVKVASDQYSLPANVSAVTNSSGVARINFALGHSIGGFYSRILAPLADPTTRSQVILVSDALQ